MNLELTPREVNDLLLLVSVASTLTLPVLVMKTDLTVDEAMGIVERMDGIEPILERKLLAYKEANNG